MVQHSKDKNIRYNISTIMTLQKQGINKVKINWYVIIIDKITHPINARRRNPIYTLNNPRKRLNIVIT